MEYGLTEKGFVAKSLQVILEEERSAYRNAFGEDIDLSDDSVDGAYVGNQAVKLAQLWELLEGLWAAGDVNSAGGIYLDRLAAFASRQQAVCTLVYTALWGYPGTVISKGHRAKLATGEQFRLKQTVTMSADNLLGFSFKVSEAVTGSFQIEKAIISYTAEDSDAEETIQAALAAQLEFVCPGVYCFKDSGKDGIVIHNKEGIKPFVLSLDDTNIELLSLGVFGIYEAEQAGPLFVPAKTLYTIVTNVDGLDSMRPVLSGEIWKVMLNCVSIWTVDKNKPSVAIQNEIQKLHGVQYVKVYSNRSAVEFQGRPPKSYEAVVMGGDDNEIVQTIFDRGPAGIWKYGDYGT